MSNTIPVEYYNNTVKQAGVMGAWWNQHPDRIHESVFPLVARIIESQSYRANINLRFASLYQNMEIVSLKAGNYSKVPNVKTFMTNRMSYNVIKSCVDTATAKIAKEKPRPIFLTENGNWGLQQKAKRLTQYIQGIFATVGTGIGSNKSLYGLGKQAFKDCAIYGTGATFFYAQGNQIKAERAVINEIIIDDIEGMYGTPRQINRVRQIDKDVLMQLYPKKKRQIKEAMTTQSQLSSVDTGSEMVDVIESWHLRSGESAKDGKHTICIENCTLHYEKYDDDFFPFIFQRWTDKTLGFFGSGLGEELAGLQLEINKILRTIQKSQNLASVPQVWLEGVNKVPSRTINNEIGGIKYYVGKPPIIFTPTAQNPELYQHLETLYKKAYEISGISQITASGKKPAGLDAAVAIREMRDAESERFSIQQGMYEDYFMDATDLIYKMSAKMNKRGQNPVVQFKEGNSLKKLKFSDVDIGENKFTVRPYPTNFLPSEPAGKLQKVVEMIQAGFYDKEEAQELLDYPDLKKVQNLKTAQREDILRVLEKMIEEEKYQTPEPYMNLELAKGIAQSYYLRARCDSAPENVLDLIRTFIDDVKGLIDIQNKPPVVLPPPEVVETKNQLLPPPPLPGLPPEGLDALPPGPIESVVPTSGAGVPLQTGVPLPPPRTPLLTNNPNLPV